MSDNQNSPVIEAEIVTETEKSEPKEPEIPENKDSLAQKKQALEDSIPSVDELEKEKSFTVRSEETGDKVYLIRQNKRYWVRNPETLAKMGFYLGQEKKIPFSKLLEYSEGEPIDLTIPQAVMPWDKPEIEQKSEDRNVWA